MDNQITIEGMKSQAKALRDYLSEQGLSLSHSKSLEAVARSHDFRDWNTASALVAQAEKFWDKEYEELKKRVEIDPDKDLYATKMRLVYSGCQHLGNAFRVPAHTSTALIIEPTVSPYFEPKAIRIIGSEVSNPSINRRFFVGAVTVGGSPQLACNNLHPERIEDGALISDVFNRSRDPLLLNWSVCSVVGLARELKIHVYNPNKQDIFISSCLWGNAVSSLDLYP